MRLPCWISFPEKMVTLVEVLNAMSAETALPLVTLKLQFLPAAKPRTVKSPELATVVPRSTPSQVAITLAPGNPVKRPRNSAARTEEENASDTSARTTHPLRLKDMTSDTPCKCGPLLWFRALEVS